MRDILEKLDWKHVLVAFTILIILYVIGTRTSLFSSKCTLPTDPPADKQPEGFTGDKPECVLYYAMWCGYSREFLPQWKKFEEFAAGNLNVNTKSIRCEGDEEGKCNQDGVRGYPTVVLYLPNNQKVQYEGNRTAEDIAQWCRKLTQ